MRFRALGLVVSLVSALVVVAAAGPLEPLVVDWASYFTVDWQATQLDDRAVVRGTVSNPTGWSAKRIQLLVEGLPMAPASASYRVRIFAFDTSRRK